MVEEWDKRVEVERDTDSSTLLNGIDEAEKKCSVDVAEYG